MNHTTFNAHVAVITIISGIIALASYLLVPASVDYDLDVFSDISLLLTLPGVRTGRLRWSMILDVFGYYFLLLPAIILIAEWLKPETRWNGFFRFCGVIYIISGAIGATLFMVDLGMLAAATWWIGIGFFIIRQYKIFGVVTIIPGRTALSDSLGSIFSLKALSGAGLNTLPSLSIF